MLADADDYNAGIASGVNNAIARVAGLLAVAALGAVIAAQFASQLNDRIDRGDALARVDGRRAGRREARAGGRRRVRACRRGEGAQVAAAVEAASVSAFHTGMGISAALVARGRDPRDRARPYSPLPPSAAEDCAGGQLVAAPADAVRERVAVPA